MREHDAHTLESIIERRGGFGHREHLELVWSYLEHYDRDEAQRAVASAIRHLAQAHGAPDKYHETITQAWVHLVAVHRAESDAESFDEFIAVPGNVALLDRRLLDGHYSHELIGSSEARARWVEPDLRELPLAA